MDINFKNIKKYTNSIEKNLKIKIDCFSRQKYAVMESTSVNDLYWYYYVLFNELYSKYHNKNLSDFIADISGVNFIKKINNAKDFNSILMGFLNQNKFVILVTDLYYEEKQPNYKLNNRHYNNFIIIKEYIEDKKQYLIIGEEYEMQKEEIANDSNMSSYSEQLISEERLKKLTCKNGFINCNLKDIKECNSTDCFFVYYSLEEVNMEKFKFNKLMEHYMHHINYMKNILKDYFLKFASDVEKYINNLSYYQGLSFEPYPEEVSDFMIHYNSLKIQQKFFDLLINGYNQKGKLNQLFFSVITIGHKIKYLLIKSLFSQDSTFCYPVINYYLNCMMNDEYILYEYLVEIIEDIENSIIKNIVYVNIEKYINNNGVSKDITSHGANFTKTGMSFYFGDRLTDYLKDVKFKIINVNDDNLNDNISCLEQKITLPKDFYTVIYLAGCAEFGNYKDKMIVKYSNGSEQEIIIGFTDWILPPVYKETILFEGKLLETINGERHIKEGFDTQIFSRSYDLNCNEMIDNIILPNNSNIHIFAISLIKKD